MTPDEPTPPPTLEDLLRPAQIEALGSDLPAVRVVLHVDAETVRTSRRVYVDIPGEGTYAIRPRPDCGACDGDPAYRLRPANRPCMRPGCVGERIAMLVGLASVQKHFAEVVTAHARAQQPSAPEAAT